MNKHIRKGVSSKWHDLGLELLEQEDEERLNEIKTNNPSDVSECCKEMFQLWLRKCTNATWSQLIQALKEVELNNLATTIEGMLLPTEEIVYASAGKYVTTIYCKSFEVEKFRGCRTNCNLLENICGWMVVLNGKAYYTSYVFHWKSFTVTDRSMKTVKLFTLNIYSSYVRLATYSM